MRTGVRPEGVLEHLALWGNLGPVPVAEAMFGMATARVIMAGVRLGIYAARARESGTAEQTAAECRLSLEGTRHLLDCLTALGHLERTAAEKPFYRLTNRAARWLDPASPTYIGAFLEFNYDQWEWWSRLEEVVQNGRSFEIHAEAPDDPKWRPYITAMFQLARLSAPEVAHGLRLPANPTRLLDLAGGHGWFAVALCRQHPTLEATILDLPGSARIGREILREQAEHAPAVQEAVRRVRHQEGDMMTDDLLTGGDSYDAVLCFQIIHHLTPEQNIALFRRVHAALKPGGTIAVLDYFTPPTQRRPDTAAFLGLHFFLTSTAATYRSEDLAGWLHEAGFAPPRRVPLRRLPIQALFQATKV